MADVWEWVAELADGTRVRERDAKTFYAVDAERCVAVELHRPRLLGLSTQKVRLEADLARGERLRCFRQRRVLANLNGGWVQPQASRTVVAREGGSPLYLLAEDDGTVDYGPTIPD